MIDAEAAEDVIATHGASRHLVDPELLPMLDGFKPLILTKGNLEAVRAFARQRALLSQNSQVAARSVRSAAPGPKGAADVDVLIHWPEVVEAPLPCILHMHGGGYMFGSAAAEASRHRLMAASLSCCVASIEYRLAPETPFPGAIEDCYAALAWLVSHAAELDIDASRIGVMGESAGGGLAASLALMARDRGDYALAFQHLIYPMIDDRTGGTDHPHPYAGEFLWTAQNNQFGWASLLGGAPGAADVSPYAAAARAQDLSGLPPAYLSTGALDLFVDDTLDYARRLMRAGAPVELKVYPGAFHGFDYDPSAAVSVRAREDSLAALARALHGPAGSMRSPRGASL
jgi:triacylglycerol lipase